MHGREPTPIPFSTEALRANLQRLENEWETVQASRDRDAIYQYLTAVFELVMWWAKEGKAVKRAHRALAPARVFFDQRARTVRRRHSLHV